MLNYCVYFFHSIPYQVLCNYCLVLASPLNAFSYNPYSAILCLGSESITSYSLHLEKQHDALLDSLFEVGTYKKLYSYRHLINGFAIHMSEEQVKLAVFILQFSNIMFHFIHMNADFFLI